MCVVCVCLCVLCVCVFECGVCVWCVCVCMSVYTWEVREGRRVRERERWRGCCVEFESWVRCHSVM